VPPIETPITSWFPHPRCDRCSLCELKNQGADEGGALEILLMAGSFTDDEHTLVGDS